MLREDRRGEGETRVRGRVLETPIGCRAEAFYAPRGGARTLHGVCVDPLEQRLADCLRSALYVAHPRLARRNAWGVDRLLGEALPRLIEGAARGPDGFYVACTDYVATTSMRSRVYMLCLVLEKTGGRPARICLARTRGWSRALNKVKYFMELA